MLVVRHRRMELAGWKSELKIAVLSDLHVGSPHVGLDKVRTIVEKINVENPALVVLLGDFVTGGPNGRRAGGFVEPELIAEELKKLHAPLGVYATLASSRSAIPNAEHGAAARMLPDLQPIMQSADVQEGMRAFLERRPGKFEGR